MYNIKEEIIKELHKLDKISHKKEDSAQHYLERSEHYYKRGEYDLSKSYLSKAKDTWMSETDRDWYADLESKLSKKGRSNKPSPKIINDMKRKTKRIIKIV